MSVQRFLKSEEALELLNSLDSDESDVEIVLCINLLKSLGEQGFRATGTIRENRIIHECPLEESKSMRKKERGSSDFAFDENSEIFVMR
ncbi:piggyBac transposable element-derived protein 3 [Trichonephila clavata]|uniref:PiggyBac transposable element-derived protein 3 n=1 Tax=Trichonephila clavata TaxID=2740835 RepID=A0A8X6G6M7_TRICU|nr:piggyBac transposable element-derived protein 3 [Trichonephila clavata]